MQKKLLIISAMLISGIAAFGLPAKPVPFKGVLAADGSEISVRLCGDENFHYYVSEADGTLLTKQGDKFVSADIDSDGRLVPSEVKVKARSRRAAIEASAADNRRRRVPALMERTTFPSFGKQKIAVVLVEYQDVKFNLSDPADYFTRMLNEEGFSDYWATGSARDWFLDSSHGLFDPEYVVMGPITLQMNRAYYGANDDMGKDSAPQKMVIEACRQLNPTVDFKEFDRDNDGYIDNVFVVYAGRGEASGGPAESVWPHTWSVTSAESGSSYVFDGVKLNRYACTNEWELSDLGHGYRPVGIGSFIHEFAHVMGLPDLYSTTYVENNYTPGYWSVMDAGPYNNDMCTPPQFSAWERMALGYLEPKELHAGSYNLAMNPVEDGDAYIITTANENEYFILENRQQNGWDTYLPGHGMLVWHVDYDSDDWNTNNVNNNPAHNRVDIIEADNIGSYSTADGDAFPGTAGVTELSATTVPALKTWAGKSTGFAFSDITEIDNRLVLRVNGGAADIASPAGVAVSEIGPASFSLTWQPVAGAIGYRATVTDGDDTVAALVYTGADASRCVISGLLPDTDYKLSLVADDGCFGSAPVIVDVTTAPPTFDYFTPSALPAEAISSGSFTARWETLEGATEYFVHLYSIEASEPDFRTEDFSAGIGNMMPGWTTTSRASYGMAAYSGQDIPSLRLSTDGDEIIVSEPGRFIRSFNFWMRGNGTSDAEQVVIEGRCGNADFEEVSSFTIPTEKGGTTPSGTLRDFLYDTLRIRFSRPSKGAVAIDDLNIGFIDPIDTYKDTHSAPSSATSLIIEGLTPGKTYKYNVQASDGTVLSHASDFIIVEIPVSASLEALPAADTQFSLHGRTLCCSAPVVVSDIAGRIVTAGCGELTLPSAGVYIVSAESLRPVKIFVK